MLKVKIEKKKKLNPWDLYNSKERKLKKKNIMKLNSQTTYYWMMNFFFKKIGLLEGEIEKKNQ
jgi:hypothetical protein